MANALSVSAPYPSLPGARVQPNLWKIAGLAAAGTAVGVGAGYLLFKRKSPAAALGGGTPAAPAVAPAVAPPSLGPSPVLEAIDEAALQMTFQRPEPMVVLLYCDQGPAADNPDAVVNMPEYALSSAAAQAAAPPRIAVRRNPPSGNALRATYETLARDPSSAGVTFAAIASSNLPPDAPDVDGICQSFDGVLWVKRIVAGQAQILDYEETAWARVGRAKGVRPQDALPHAVAWARGEADDPPHLVKLLGDPWTTTETQPPMVTVPRGVYLTIPLSPPEPQGEVTITNTVGEPVTGPGQPPFWDPQAQEVGLTTSLPGNAIITAIQGDWRRQAWIHVPK